MTETETDQSQFDFYKIQNDTEEHEILEFAIDYVKNFSADLSKMFTDKNGCKAFDLITKIIIYSRKNDYEMLESKGFAEFLSNLMDYFFSIRKDLNFDNENLNGLNKKRIVVLSDALYLQNVITRSSREFCLRFVSNNGLKTYLAFLSDEEFLQKNKNSSITDLNNNPYDLIDFFTLNLISLSVKRL